MSVFMPILLSLAIANSPAYVMTTVFNPVPITQEGNLTTEGQEQRGNGEGKNGNADISNNLTQETPADTDMEDEDTTGKTNNSAAEEPRKNSELFLPEELSKKKIDNLHDSEMFLISTDESGKRIEIIHTKEVSPAITVVSPDGQIYAGVDAQNGVTIKSNITMQAYPTLSYSVVYLPKTTDGHWKMSVAKIQEARELVVVSSKYSGITPQSIEKMMFPDELIAWYLSDTSVYTETSLADITSEETENSRQPVSHKKENPETESPNTSAFTFLGILLSIIIFFLYKKGKKAKEKIDEKKREERVRAANEAMQEKLAHENEELAEIIAAHESEYVDYPEAVNYRNWQPEDIPDTAHKYEERKNIEVEKEESSPPVPPETTPQPFTPNNSSIFF